MGMQHNPNLLHWNYFLALETDIEHLARYVEFSERNFEVYSLEITHILLASSSEVDVVAKQLCQRILPEPGASRINEYRDVLRKAIPELETIAISLPRYGLEFTPWASWKENETPSWWLSHNKVKHQRDENYHKANLENVLNAMSGLFALILYFYKDIAKSRRIEPPPSIFTPPSNLASVCPSVGGRMALFYKEEVINN